MQLVQDAIECEQLGEITVKGIAKPVHIYAVKGVKEQVTRTSHIRHKQPGLDIDLDLGTVDRQQAREKLKALLDSL